MGINYLINSYLNIIIINFPFFFGDTWIKQNFSFFLISGDKLEEYAGKPGVTCFFFKFMSMQFLYNIYI